MSNTLFDLILNANVIENDTWASDEMILDSYGVTNSNFWTYKYEPNGSLYLSVNMDDVKKTEDFPEISWAFNDPKQLDLFMEDYLGDEIDFIANHFNANGFDICKPVIYTKIKDNELFIEITLGDYIEK